MLDQDATEGQMIWDDSQVGYRFHGRTGQMNCLFLSGQEKKKKKTKTENLLDPTELLQTHQLIWFKDTWKVFTPSGLEQPKHWMVPGLFRKT